MMTLEHVQTANAIAKGIGFVMAGFGLGVAYEAFTLRYRLGSAKPQPIPALPVPSCPPYGSSRTDWTRLHDQEIKALMDAQNETELSQFDPRYPFLHQADAPQNTTELIEQQLTPMGNTQNFDWILRNPDLINICSVTTDPSQQDGNLWVAHNTNPPQDR